MIDRLILAIQFLTLLPVRKNAAVTAKALAESMAWFPVVGAMLGALIAATDYAIAGILPPSVRAGIVLLLLALTNGGLHLDGLADTIDGLAGGRTPEERLAIMRDSAIGPIGAVFLGLVLLIQYSCLTELTEPARFAAILLFPMAGRWSMVLLSSISTYARAEGGVGEAFSGTSAFIIITATMITAVTFVYLSGPPSLGILAVLGVCVALVSRFFKSRLGGVTGDVFGFQCEVGETLFLVFFLIMLRVI